MEEGGAQSRWQRLVRARMDEIERLGRTHGPTTPQYWDAEAHRFLRRLGIADDDDPVLLHLRSRLQPDDVVVDVGAGTGRFAIPLAAAVRHVIATDPSAAMLARLNDEAAQRQLGNIDTRLGSWPATRAQGDLVLCAFVLPVVAEPADFLVQLNAAARREVIVVMAGASNDLLQDVFWSHFHGRPRSPAPTFLDAVQLLAELGIDAAVRVIEAPTLVRFADVDDAVDDYRRSLLLPDEASVAAELRRALAPWLVADPAGLRPPFSTRPVAMLSWKPL